MALELDDRQCAMLQEMGVRVWLPHANPALQHPAMPRLEGNAPAPNPAHAAKSSPSTPGAAARATAPAFATAPNASAKPLEKALVKPLAKPALVLPTAAQAPLGDAPDTRAMDWPALVTAAAQCQACGLCAGRKNSTLQAPALAQADWMVVGDAPDAQEDGAGAAFANPAGQLLDNMLHAVAAQRGHNAYATNVVKCHPPQARSPQAAELAMCSAYLQREIQLIQPKVILSMGRFANQLLLSEDPRWQGLPLGKLRGRVYRYQGIAVVVTYHPNALMRTRADKAKAWADLCLAADVVERGPEAALP
jgi:DNA polymerase